MQLTKYEHACFVVEKQGASLVVDPGVLTTDFTPPENVAAIVITHQHPDHFDLDHINDILDDNPTAVIVGPGAVTSQLPQFETRTAHAGERLMIGGFEIDVYGKKHAVIHPSLPDIENIGVLIDDRIFYPGDALTIPEKSADVLLVPLGAPWLKESEAIEYMQAVDARLTVPTHDATLSRAGRDIYDAWLQQFARQGSTTYRRIDGETLSVQ